MSNKQTTSVERRKFEKKLAKWGMDPHEIVLCVAQWKERRELKNNGLLPVDAPLCTRAEYARLVRLRTHPNSHFSKPVLNLGNDYVSEDDKNYKPTYIDSVLTGVGRATGLAAKAVKRGKTMTKYQYDQENRE